MPNRAGVQARLNKWIKKNPERWWTATYGDIQVEADVSESTMYRIFPLLLARAANILPSEVKAKRKKHLGLSSPLDRKLSDAEIARIEQLLGEGNTPLDVAFMTGRSLSQIEKYKPKKEKERDEHV